MGDETGIDVCAASQAVKLDDCRAVMSDCVAPNVAWVRKRPASVVDSGAGGGVEGPVPEEPPVELEDELPLP